MAIIGSVQSGEVYSTTFPASPFGSGMTLSGYGYGQIASGYVGGLPAGAAISGDPYSPPTYPCPRCGEPYVLFSSGADFGAVMLFDMTDKSRRLWCKSCAGYVDGKGFRTKADVLREFCPLASNAPIYAVADWYNDQGMYKAAEYLKKVYEEGE